MTAYRLLLLAVVCAWPATVAAQDYAEKLAALSGVRVREQARAAERYRFVLPRIADACADLARAGDAADLVFVTHGLIDDAGLLEPLPELADTLHSLVMEVAPSARRATLPVKCREVFTLYVSARFNGDRPGAARATVAGAVRGVYELATEAPAPGPEPAAPAGRDAGLACLPDCSRADLRGADLYKANLSAAHLIWADLTDANLRGADLDYANLVNATLRGADLHAAYLYAANLRGADLSDANLSVANLSVANLPNAKLIGADLYDAYLIGANLIGADLTRADLSGADLTDANLSRADLSGATLPNGGAGALGCDKGGRLPGCE